MDKKEKIENYKNMNHNVQFGKIVYAGSSLMEMLPINQLMEETGCTKVLYNRGVGGFVSAELLKYIDVCILDLKPSRLFINIGTNDLSDPDISIDDLMQNYDKILTLVEERFPKVEIYLMAYYPVNPEAATKDMKECLKIRSNLKISKANERVRKLAKKHTQKYIDLNPNLQDEQGRLRAEFTIEGLHINEQGYRAIFPDFMKYVQEPAWKTVGQKDSPFKTLFSEKQSEGRFTIVQDKVLVKGKESTYDYIELILTISPQSTNLSDS